jgi:hypothetical protein
MVNLAFVDQQKTDSQFLAHIIEEAGEVISAYGKTQRWGEDSVNPLLPKAEQETNFDWLMREIDDLDGAIQRWKARRAAAVSPLRKFYISDFHRDAQFSLLHFTLRDDDDPQRTIIGRLIGDGALSMWSYVESGTDFRIDGLRFHDLTHRLGEHYKANVNVPPSLELQWR